MTDQVLKVLRSESCYNSKTEAIEALKGKLTSEPNDGEICIARYKLNNDVRTLIGVNSIFATPDGVKYTIFDADAIPADVQAALEALKGGTNTDDQYGTIKKISDALKQINGEGDGSIKKALEDAKDYTDGKINALDVTDAEVAGSYVSAVSETDGMISVSRKSITSSDQTVTLNTADGVDLKVNIDNSTIVRNGENGQLSVASAALVQYVGQDAINVSEVSDDHKTISLKINDGDKVLTQSADGLFANINLTWSKTDGLKLIGKGGTEIAKIAATDFIKDGMLDNVVLKVASAGSPVGGKTEGTFLVFTFNTDAGKQEIDLDVTTLIDVYTAGDGLQLSDKKFSIKRDGASESFLIVGPDGIKLSGVNDAINSKYQTNAAAIDKIEGSVGLTAGGDYTDPKGNYTTGSTTVVDAISKLDTQVKANATEAERIKNDVIGENQLPDSKSVMDVVVENEKTAAEAIKKLATATGVLKGEEIAYTAPTKSGNFSDTTSVMEMLNKIDEDWNVIDCGTY